MPTDQIITKLQSIAGTSKPVAGNIINEMLSRVNFMQRAMLREAIMKWWKERCPKRDLNNLAAMVIEALED